LSALGRSEPPEDPGSEPGPVSGLLMASAAPVPWLDECPRIWTLRDLREPVEMAEATWEET